MGFAAATPVEERVQESAQAEGGGDAPGEPEDYRRRRLAEQHQADHLVATGTQCHAHADLPAPRATR